MLLDIVIAIIMFGLIIAVHELGHFAVAKLCGIRVNAFSIGMGPAIFKKKKGETEYALRLIPAGGYCAMEGEDTESDDPRAFHRKSIPKRFAVVAAGAIMNLLLGFLLLIFVTSQDTAVTTTQIAGFRTDAEGNSVSTSDTCGLQVDDKIVRVNGMYILSDVDLSYKLQNTESDLFTVEVERDGERKTIKDVVFKNTENDTRLDFYVYGEEKTVGSVIRYSACKTISTARLIWATLKDLITGKYGFHDLTGPVGIVSVIGEAATLGETLMESLLSVLGIVIYVTINVGVFNLLPLPALDGGRLFFLLVEAVIRKPIPAEKEGMVHAVGLLLLLLLMAAITIKDVIALF